MVDVVLLHPASHCVAVDAEMMGGAQLDPVTHDERADYSIPIDLVNIQHDRRVDSIALRTNDGLDALIPVQGRGRNRAAPCSVEALRCPFNVSNGLIHTEEIARQTMDPRKHAPCISKQRSCRWGDLVDSGRPRTRGWGAKARNGNALKAETIRGDGSGYMSKKLRRLGRPKNGTEQRSIRVPEGLWDQLTTIAKARNRERDPFVDGKLSPSSMLMWAAREWLEQNGYSTEVFDVSDEEVA